MKEKMEKAKKPEARKPEERPRILSGTIVRILATDIPGETTIYHGLTRIRGVSWSFSNAVCLSLGMDKKKKVSSLTENEIEKIVSFIKKPVGLKPFLLNRRRDIDTGEDKHLATSDLDMQRDFDIRRMKQIRSYKGWRHALGQPVRGQRTRSHFRKGGKAVGVQRAKPQPAKAK
ncbi:MAG: 30S ribosomal protein S13 [archaeon]